MRGPMRTARLEWISGSARGVVRRRGRRTAEAAAARHGARRDPGTALQPAYRGGVPGMGVEGRVSASTQNQALAALLLLYGPVLGVDLPRLDDLVRPTRLPVVPSRDEVGEILRTPRSIAVFLYGSALRLLECARLGVKDVDFAGNRIGVRSGKGDGDRLTLLPEVVAPILQCHLVRVRALHEGDLRLAAGWIELPHAVGQKPKARRERAWRWVFRNGHPACRPPGGTRRRPDQAGDVIPSSIRLRRTCWRTDVTFEPSSSSSPIGISGRR